jgi:hypothetical protein
MDDLETKNAAFFGCSASFDWEHLGKKLDGVDDVTENRSNRWAEQSQNDDYDDGHQDQD